VLAARGEQCLKGSKYKVGDLVSCYYKTIPPSPTWDPFVEGRPAIILEVRQFTNIRVNKGAKFHYTVSVSTFEGGTAIRLVSEENLLPYKDIPDLDKEIDELVMNYYKKYPLATD
jgi:hypothetical protein